MAYQSVTFTAGEPLDEVKLNQLAENTRVAKDGVDIIKTRQYSRYTGSGNSTGGWFYLTSYIRGKNTDTLVIADQMSNNGLGNYFRALTDCWVTFTAYFQGNTTHGYSNFRQYFAAGGWEYITVDTTHEGSTTGYTFSTRVFMNQGDVVRLYRDYWPTQPSNVVVSLQADKHLEGDA